MRIFVSYASQQHGIAAPLVFALRNADHTVFFDEDRLQAGDEFHDRIRQEVEDAELFIFLISPESVSDRRYTLTELKYARKNWPKAKGNVLPVMAEATSYDDIPAYLKSVDILEPAGNLEAETLATVASMQKTRRFWSRIAAIVLLPVAIVTAAAATWLWAHPRFELTTAISSASSVLLAAVLAVFVLRKWILQQGQSLLRSGSASATGVGLLLLSTTLTPEVLWILPGINILNRTPIGAASPYTLTLDSDGEPVTVEAFGAGGVVLGDSRRIIELALKRGRDRSVAQLEAYLADRGVGQPFQADKIQRWIHGDSQILVTSPAALAAAGHQLHRVDGHGRINVMLSLESNVVLQLAFVEPQE